jgi:hypothetical protein
LKNVDAGAAKELMACLVKLQSSLTEVNEYVCLYTFKFSFFIKLAFLINPFKDRGTTVLLSAFYFALTYFKLPAKAHSACTSSAKILTWFWREDTE